MNEMRECSIFLLKIRFEGGTVWNSRRLQCDERYAQSRNGCKRAERKDALGCTI